MSAARRCFFSSRRRHTRWPRDWSSDVCSSDLGLNLSVADKLVIARQLDEFGVGFIEGGWPGAIPKDTEFFRRAATELDLRHAQLAAFGATRRPGVKAEGDPLVAALRESGAPVVTLGAKSHDRHV